MHRPIRQSSNNKVAYEKIFALASIALVLALCAAKSAYGTVVLTVNNLPPDITLTEGQSQTLSLSLMNTTAGTINDGTFASVTPVFEPPGDMTDSVAASITSGGDCSSTFEAAAGLAGLTTCTFDLLLTTPSAAGETDHDSGAWQIQISGTGLESSGFPIGFVSSPSTVTVNDPPPTAAEPGAGLLLLVAILGGLWFERKRLLGRGLGIGV